MRIHLVLKVAYSHSTCKNLLGGPQLGMGNRRLFCFVLFCCLSGNVGEGPWNAETVGLQINFSKWLNSQVQNLQIVRIDWIYDHQVWDVEPQWAAILGKVVAKVSRAGDILGQGRKTFCAKGLGVNILGFAGHTNSGAPKLCRCGQHRTNGHGCAPANLYFCTLKWISHNFRVTKCSSSTDFFPPVI